jgi:hypothetical protein
MNRRFLLTASATALAVQRIFGAESRYKIGYTTNTRGSYTSPSRSPKDSERITSNYIQNTMKIPL